MKMLTVPFYLSMIVFVTACSTTNVPIMTYDEALVLDRENVSVIYFPAEIELLEVDGQEIKTPFIAEGYHEVRILAGKHQLALKYVAFWGDATSGSIVSSKPVVFGLDITPKSTYFIKYAKPRGQWQAEHLANTFAPWVETASGKKVTTVHDKVSGKKRMTQPLKSVNTPLQKLKFWWKNASFKEKKQFEGWMGNN